jgi:hypothetical protein
MNIQENIKTLNDEIEKLSKEKSIFRDMVTKLKM